MRDMPLTKASGCLAVCLSVCLAACQAPTEAGPLAWPETNTAPKKGR